MKDGNDILNAMAQAVRYDDAQARLAELRAQVETARAATKAAQADVQEALLRREELWAEANELMERVKELRQTGEDGFNTAQGALRDANAAHARLLKEIHKLEAVEPPDEEAIKTAKKVLA